MKYFVGFIFADGRTREVREERTNDFKKMKVPEDAVGGIVIGLKDPLKLGFGKILLDYLDIGPITYFAKKFSSDEILLDLPGHIWIKTRTGALMQVAENAILIDI